MKRRAGDGAVGDFGWLKETFKYDTRVLGSLQRHLLAANEKRNAHRDTTRLHPSEMSKDDWCARRSTYFFRGLEPDKEAKDRFKSWRMALIMEEGHEIHDKWQRWLWEMGVLEGQWHCHACGNEWWTVAARFCPACDSPFIRYDEVPLSSDELFIMGNADGIVADRKGRVLIEIKSIGMRTLAFEVPGIYDRYVEGASVDKVWGMIRRPFPSHIRQASIYAHVLGLKTIVFIYEFKANQAVKEFAIPYNEKLIADRLQGARLVSQAMKEEGTIVPRPKWAEHEDVEGCKSCAFRERCWGLATADTEPTKRVKLLRRSAA